MVSQPASQLGERRARHRRGEGGLLRDELIEAARRLLTMAEREADLSIRAVTRAAGVAPQSFYLQFASLDELLYALYAIEYGHLRQAMDTAARSAVTPSARLLAACAAYCRYAEQYPGRYRALTVVRGQARHQGWEDGNLPGGPTFQLIRDLAASALEVAGSGADSFLVGSTLWAALHGLVTLRRARPAFPWPRLETMIATVVEQALKP
jgi:AcrR family transcriptional regulator